MIKDSSTFKRLPFPGQSAPCPFTENILSAYKHKLEQKG